MVADATVWEKGAYLVVALGDDLGLTVSETVCALRTYWRRPKAVDLEGDALLSAAVAVVVAVRSREKEKVMELDEDHPVYVEKIAERVALRLETMEAIARDQEGRVQVGSLSDSFVRWHILEAYWRGGRAATTSRQISSRQVNAARGFVERIGTAAQAWGISEEEDRGCSKHMRSIIESLPDWQAISENEPDRERLSEEMSALATRAVLSTHLTSSCVQAALVAHCKMGVRRACSQLDEARYRHRTEIVVGDLANKKRTWAQSLTTPEVQRLDLRSVTAGAQWRVFPCFLRNAVIENTIDHNRVPGDYLWPLGPPLPMGLIDSSLPTRVVMGEHSGYGHAPHVLYDAYAAFDSADDRDDSRLSTDTLILQGVPAGPTRMQSSEVTRFGMLKGNKVQNAFAFDSGQSDAENTLAALRDSAYAALVRQDQRATAQFYIERHLSPGLKLNLEPRALDAAGVDLWLQVDLGAWDFDARTLQEMEEPATQKAKLTAIRTWLARNCQRLDELATRVTFGVSRDEFLYSALASIEAKAAKGVQNPINVLTSKLNSLFTPVQKEQLPGKKKQENEKAEKQEGKAKGEKPKGVAIPLRTGSEQIATEAIHRGFAPYTSYIVKHDTKSSMLMLKFLPPFVLSRAFPHARFTQYRHLIEEDLEAQIAKKFKLQSALLEAQVSLKVLLLSKRGNRLYRVVQHVYVRATDLESAQRIKAQLAGNKIKCSFREPDTKQVILVNCA